MQYLLDTDLRRQDILEYLKNLVLNTLSDYHVTVYLFGSWARGSERNTSDIDIGIWYEEGAPDNLVTELRSIVEQSEIPYTVEIVDLNTVDQGFLRNVRKTHGKKSSI